MSMHFLCTYLLTFIYTYTGSVKMFLECICYTELTFSGQSACICALKDMVEVAKVHIFVQSCTEMLLVEVCAHTASPRYLFLNIVLYNVLTLFCCYLLDVCTGFSPLSANYISPLCGTLEAPQNGQPHVRFLALCVEGFPLPTCKTNVAVHSLGGRGWPPLDEIL
jgi:hypothetical protein